MAKIKPNTANALCRFTSFKGICPGKGFRESGAAYMRNFRILPDGSLEKRCGWRSEATLPAGNVRGFWEGSVNATDYFFVVVGDQICRYRSDLHTVTPIYTLSTSSGKVGFLFYHENLYCFDGSEILRFFPSSQTFLDAVGYVPLYGVNWHPTTMGSVKEPLNMMHSKIRIQYLNSSASTTFRLPFTTTSIDKMIINGSAVTTYSFVSGSNTFSIPSSLVGGTVDVYLTVDNAFSQRSTLARASMTALLFNDKHETAFAFGGSPGYRIYYSKAVDEELLKTVQTVYPNADALYFPQGGNYVVGDSTHPITAVCPQDDRLLVSTERDLFALDYPESESKVPEMYPIDCSAGCCATGGMIRLENNVLTVQKSGIYRLLDFGSDPYGCGCTLISEDLTDELSPDAFSRLIVFWRQSQKEIWIRDPSDASGKAYIYNTVHKNWVVYTNISASAFFETDGKFGFFHQDGKLCLFEENLLSDNGSTKIIATYRSHFFHFSDPENPKRTLRITAAGYSGATATLVTAETDKTSTVFALQTSTVDRPKVTDFRWNAGRFRYFRWQVMHSGSDRCRLYFLSVSAKH